MSAAHPPILLTQRRFIRCLGIVALAMFGITIHGYHYGIEDEALYLPAIKKLLGPVLYPNDSQFFKPNLSLLPRPRFSPTTFSKISRGCAILSIPPG